MDPERLTHRSQEDLRATLEVAGTRSHAEAGIAHLVAALVAQEGGLVLPLLGAVFFGILLPIGWVLRWTGRLQYHTRFDPDAASYRIEVEPDRAVRLEEPF